MTALKTALTGALITSAIFGLLYCYRIIYQSMIESCTLVSGGFEQLPNFL